jgi:hypothetical protein
VEENRKRLDQMTTTNEDEVEVLREQESIYAEDSEEDYLKHTSETGEQYNVFYEFVSSQVVFLVLTLF